VLICVNTLLNLYTNPSSSPDSSLRVILSNSSSAIRRKQLCSNVGLAICVLMQNVNNRSLGIFNTRQRSSDLALEGMSHGKRAIDFPRPSYRSPDIGVDHERHFVTKDTRPEVLLWTSRVKWRTCVRVTAKMYDDELDIYNDESVEEDRHDEIAKFPVADKLKRHCLSYHRRMWRGHFITWTCHKKKE